MSQKAKHVGKRKVYQDLQQPLGNKDQTRFSAGMVGRRLVRAARVGRELIPIASQGSMRRGARPWVSHLLLLLLLSASQKMGYTSGPELNRLVDQEPALDLDFIIHTSIDEIMKEHQARTHTRSTQTSPPKPYLALDIVSLWRQVDRRQGHSTAPSLLYGQFTAPALSFVSRPPSSTRPFSSSCRASSSASAGWPAGRLASDCSLPRARVTRHVPCCIRVLRVLLLALTSGALEPTSALSCRSCAQYCRARIHPPFLARLARLAKAHILSCLLLPLALTSCLPSHPYPPSFSRRHRPRPKTYLLSASPSQPRKLPRLPGTKCSAVQVRSCLLARNRIRRKPPPHRPSLLQLHHQRTPQKKAR